jgi:hypothetical protein
VERSLVELESLVRNKLCRFCKDRAADGGCGLEQPGDCALFRLFPQVVHAIQATNSDNINDYVMAIRGGVCVLCKEQSSDGSCEKRHEVQCTLNAYLLLVVDAIEEATGRDFGRAALDAGRRWTSQVDPVIH